jgi:hypothetical protein
MSPEMEQSTSLVQVLPLSRKQRAGCAPPQLASLQPPVSGNGFTTKVVVAEAVTLCIPTRVTVFVPTSV